jgi:uncharacterized membrane protein YgdD (TMEM256/DUF423 family)
MKTAHVMMSAAVLGGLSVILGAFGAHALTQVFDAAQLAIWETAVRYQMYHALALLGIAVLAQVRPGVWLFRAAICMLVGVCLFSGSLYVLLFSGIRLIGIITPVGGVCLIAGWLSLCIGAYQQAKD